MENERKIFCSHLRMVEINTLPIEFDYANIVIHTLVNFTSHSARQNRQGCREKCCRNYTLHISPSSCHARRYFVSSVVSSLAGSILPLSLLPSPFTNDQTDADMLTSHAILAFQLKLVGNQLVPEAQVGKANGPVSFD